MRKILICLLMTGVIISVSACGKFEDLVPVYKPESSADAALEEAVGAGEVKDDATSQQAASTAETAVEKETTPIMELYQEEINSIIDAMDKNIEDNSANALYKSYSRGDVADCDSTESKQLILLYTEDGNNLNVELMRADSNGYLLTVRDDLGLLAGSLTAEVKTGLYESAPALFVITTNYDGSTKFGTVYVYSLKNHDIEYVYEESYEGNDQYNSLDQGLLASCGDVLCKFGESGVGQKINEIKLK